MEENQGDVIEVVVDRVSQGDNLVARESERYHVIPKDVEGKVPSPGERWKVEEIEHYRHPVAWKPITHIETIEDYDPLYGKTRSHREPIRRPNKPRPDKTTREKNSSRKSHTGGSPTKFRNKRPSDNPFSKKRNKNDLINNKKL